MAFLAVGVQVPPSAFKYLLTDGPMYQRESTRSCLNCPPVGVLFFVASMTFLSMSCSSATPLESLDKTLKAAEAGDAERFWAGLTSESRAILQGLHSFPHEGIKYLHLSRFSHSVHPLAVDQKGDYAYVQVRTDKELSESAVLVMRKEDGQWLLDMVETELLWNAQWALSGDQTLPAEKSWDDILMPPEGVLQDLEKI